MLQSTVHWLTSVQSGGGRVYNATGPCSHKIRKPILIYDHEHPHMDLLLDGIGHLYCYTLNFKQRLSFKWAKRCIKYGKILKGEIEDILYEPDVRVPEGRI